MSMLNLRNVPFVTFIVTSHWGMTEPHWHLTPATKRMAAFSPPTLYPSRDEGLAFPIKRKRTIMDGTLAYHKFLSVL